MNCKILSSVLDQSPIPKSSSNPPHSLHTTTLQIAQQTKDAVIPALSDTSYTWTCLLKDRNAIIPDHLDLSSR